MQYSTHVSKIQKNCFHYINVLRSLCGVSWGSDPTCLLRLYVGLIRPKLEYMAPILLDCNINDMKILNRIQWKALRTALGAMISTHTLSLEQAANIIPLPERFDFIANSVINKICANNRHPARPFLEKLATLTNKLKFVNMFAKKTNDHNYISFSIHPLFTIPYEVLANRPIVKFLPVNKSVDSPSTMLNKYNKSINSWKNYTKIFTDGSKTLDTVGCGFWVPNIDVEAYFPLNKHSSIFTAEALGILEALEFAKIQETRKFLIVSDSKSVLMAIANFVNSNSHPYIFKIKSLLYTLKINSFSIHLLWVPSHVGIEGNDYADMVASSGCPEAGSNDMVIHKDIKALDRSEALQSWQSRWDSSEFGRHFYDIEKYVNKDPWFKNLNLPRKLICMINRLKFNHTRCKDHVYKINIVPNNICSCSEVQTANHLLFACSNISRSLRTKLVDDLSKAGITTFELQSLLKLNNVKIYQYIYDFFTIAKADIYLK